MMYIVHVVQLVPLKKSALFTEMWAESIGTNFDGTVCTTAWGPYFGWYMVFDSTRHGMLLLGTEWNFY